MKITIAAIKEQPLSTYWISHKLDPNSRYNKRYFVLDHGYSHALRLISNNYDSFSTVANLSPISYSRKLDPV